MREIAAVALADRYASYPARGLTPERLANILREAADGNILRQAELFEEMEERDTHLFSVLSTRKNAVMGLDWEVVPAGKEKQARIIAAFVREALAKVLDDALLDILDAIGKGFSGHEIMWEIADRRAVVAELRHIPQKCFTFGTNLRELRVLTEENPVLGEPLTANKFVIHLYRAKSGHPSRAGLLRICAWMYLFKNYDIKDWVAFAEVYGMPLRLGKYDPGASKEEKDALIQALRQLGTDAAGIIPTSAMIEFIEAAKTSSAQVYERLAAFCNAEMSKAILGQTLTTEIGDRGSYAASRTHQQVRQDLLEADCKALSSTLKCDLIRPLVQFNFGPDAPLPSIKFRYEPPEDLQQTANTYKVLAEAGLAIPARHVYARFGIPEPQPGEAILTPQAIAATAPLAMKAPGLWPGGYRSVRLAAGGRPTMRAANRAADVLADNALARALPIIEEDILAPLRELIEFASSLEEIIAALPVLYPELDLDRLEELTQQALYIADLNGRYSEHG